MKTVLTPTPFDPRAVLQLIAQERVTSWGAVPTMVHRVVDCPDAASTDLSSIESISIGGAALPPSVLTRAQALFGLKPKLGNGYGLTEAHGPVTMNAGRSLGTSTREQRRGLAALLDYAREGDAIVVVGIDRLGRNAAEVMTTIRELGERGIALRSLREGIDTSNATGRMVAGVLASLAELELELGRERRSAAREARRARGQSIGRPKALSQSKAAFARKLHAQGEPASIIAAELEVSRATIYRVLAEEAD
jgi:acyl-CoA synthetase (AMP-forming)/AMP-acid ligase II